MSDDIKVNLLLQEVKDDPRFLSLTSNSIRATSSELLNEPLLSFAGMAGSMPKLSAVSDNVPNIFDVKLDLFQVLRVDLDVNIANVTDILSRFFGKNIDQNLTSSDRYTYFLNTLKTDVFSAVSSQKLTVARKNEDKAKLKEEIDVILGGKRLLDSIKINSREIKKKINFFFHRREVGNTFNLVKLAEDLARPGLLDRGLFVTTNPLRKLVASGVILGTNTAGTPLLEDVLTDARYTGSDFTGKGTKAPPSFVASDNNNSSGGALVTLTWGGPYSNHGQLPTEKPFYATDFYTRGRFFNSSSFEFGWVTWPTYPVYHNLKTGKKGMLLPRGGPNETEAKFISSEGTIFSRLVFWWEPGYEDQYTEFKSNSINEGNLIILHPSWLSGSSSGTGQGAMSGLKTIFAPSSTIGITIQAGYYEETIQGPFGPALVPREIGFDAVAVADKLISIIRTRLISLEDQITLLDKLIRPAKSRITADRLRSSIKVNKKQTIELQEQLMQTIMELHPHKVGKGLIEKPTARQSILTAKGRIEKDTLLAEIEQKLKVGINVSVEGITIANHKFKKVTQRKLDNIEVKNSLLTKPAFSLILKNDATVEELKKIKTTKDLKIKLESIDRMVRDIGKGQNSKGAVKDNFILPNKAKVFADRYLFKEKSKLKFGLNSIKEQLPQTIERIQKGPNKVRVSNVRLNEKVVLGGKARIASDRGVLLDILKFDPNFKIFQIAKTDASHKEFIVGKKAKTLVAALIDTIPLVAKSKLPVSTITVGSKDRDESGTGDVFFKFSFALRKEFVDFDDTKHPLLVKKNILPSVFKVRDNTLAGKARIEIEKINSVEDIQPFVVGKNLLNHKVVFDDSRFPFVVGKPIKNSIPLKDVLLNPKANITVDRFRVIQDLHDILLRRGLTDKLSIKENQKKLIHKQQGIQNTISASIKGNLFIRDEEYVTGTYFLEPYVATIPPGRSRQF